MKSQKLLNEIKLKMYYDSSKTLLENELVIKEQRVYVKDTGTGKYNLLTGPFAGINADELFPSGKYPNSFDPKTVDKDYPGTTEKLKKYDKSIGTTTKETTILPIVPNLFPKPEDIAKKNQKKFEKNFIQPLKDPKADNPYFIWDPCVKKEKIANLNRNGRIYYTEKCKGDYVPVTYENAHLREVPPGIKPSLYPEYLRKRQEIIDKYEQKKEEDAKEKLLDPKPMSSDRLGYDKFIKNTIGKYEDEKKQELDKLDKEYIDLNFPMGISQQEKNFFYTEMSKIKKEYEDNKKRIQQDPYSELQRRAEYFKSNGELPSEGGYLIQLYNKSLELKDRQINPSLYTKDLVNKYEKDYKSKKEFLELIFGYHPGYSEHLKEIKKSDLEKFWDNYGPWIEMAGWILLDVFSEGYIATISGARQSYLLAKMFKNVKQWKNLNSAQRFAKFARITTRTLLPAGIGTYKVMNEGELTEESMMYFIFSVLPWAHEAFGIAKDWVTLKICEGITEKLSKVSNLRDPVQFTKFLSGLDFFEKRVVASIWYKTPEESLAALERLAEKVGQKNAKSVATTQIGSEIYTGKPIGLIPKPTPNLPLKVVEFILKMGIRFAVDMKIIELSNHIANNIGLVKDEEKRRVKAYFDNLGKNKKDEDVLLIQFVMMKVGCLIKNKQGNVGSLELLSNRAQDDYVKLSKDPKELEKEYLGYALCIDITDFLKPIVK